MSRSSELHAHSRASPSVTISRRIYSGAFTGYLYEPEDLEKFAEPIPGKTTAVVSELAREHHCYTCFGMLEEAQVHVHRKIVEQPPFATGSEVKPVNRNDAANTPFHLGSLRRMWSALRS
ncbi:MAG: hypothetical protein KatS3mg023_1430 [Armatimonadota bacterium]|nr:MAG: hypothetical protein KatS3mg023_1430 [Armatimonadota bacterium]